MKDIIQIGKAELHPTNMLPNPIGHISYQAFFEIIKFKDELSEANATIQSLKDENERMREALEKAKIEIQGEMMWSYPMAVKQLDGSIKHEKSRTMAGRTYDILEKALTQKAEE